MAKRITKIVLTGGPAAGKTTLVSRVLKEFKQEDGWRVITIPETATELISGFGIKPFDNCMSMLQFQDFVVGDQIHRKSSHWMPRSSCRRTIFSFSTTAR